jgi:peptidoglycan/LPS O-acetylase OafA/YrhL
MTKIPIQDRDNSIDFIKGIAILSVVFLHNTPVNKLFQIAWIGQAVPLFLLVTAYLTYGSFQKGKTIKTYYSKLSIRAMLKRIFVPFLLLQCVLSIIFCLYSIIFCLSQFSMYSVIVSGGIGPGSYYPWVYLQCWIILPFIIMLVDKLSIRKSFLLFLSISVILELFTSLAHIPESIYRLLLYRYLFLIYLGCLLRKLNIKLNTEIIVLAILGLLFATIEIYTDIDFSPWFTNQWQGHHWITAFYTLLVFLLLKSLYSAVIQRLAPSFPPLPGQYAKNTQHLRRTVWGFTRCIIVLGNNSYEIFLCQMFVFSVFSKKMLFFIENEYMKIALFIALTTVLAVAPVILYKLYVKDIISKCFKYIK